MIPTRRVAILLKRVRLCSVLKRNVQTKLYNNNALPQHDNAQKTTYYKEFMKLLKQQKEPPFLYTTANHDIDNIDMRSYGTIMEVIQKQEKLTRQSIFSQIGVSRHYEHLLNKYGIVEPLPVQKRSLPVLFKRRSAIIESETGSGKTLTYLLPILHNLSNRSCSNIVIVPTRELASQVYKEALKYVADHRQVVRYVSGIDDNQERKLDRALRESQIIIGTPKRLIEIFEQKSGHFRNVKRIVLDEVDKLLTVKSIFKTNMNKVKPADRLLAMLLHQNKYPQLIATSATVSDFLIQELQDRGFTKSSQVIRCSPESYKHGKVPANIKHFFTVAKPVNEFQPDTEFSNKVKSIARLFRQFGDKSTLVFIPKSMSVQSVVSAFQDMHFAAVALYKKLLLPSTREFERFMEAFEKGEIEIVVATEETVRGMDFPFVDRMYLTYVPTVPEEYVHVAGRVGRANRHGEVITVLSGDNEASERKMLKRRFAALNVKAKKIIL